MKSVLSVLLLCFLLASCGEEKTVRERAEAGDAEAQSNLGAMYYTGNGVPKDYVEAVKWTRKAAEQGDAEAQATLGIMYQTGEGVPQDYAEAVKWYRRSAEQGRAKSLGSLGAMYYTGNGVQQDDAKAYMFFNLAAAKGVEDTEKYREQIAEKMTQEQIAEGQKLTREWLERKAKEKGE
ncbi:sel1 repeat family protein [Akkermansiaceae bacterium]|nr:sel1 repeat family protein [Akkermansiaceae bacterium]